MMSSPSPSSSSSSSSSRPHQYPEAIQLKLYQAFIFSIPILFSIILFLLFYLFYLKRRSSAAAAAAPQLLPVHGRADPTTHHDHFSGSDSDLKNHELKLCQVLFDEYMKARDSLCCVCLGELEVWEELLAVPRCKHVFHVDCIRHWLRNNSTCPLCRAPVLSHQHTTTTTTTHGLD